MLPNVSPMLATSAPLPPASSGWRFEPKLDGWRVLIYIDGDLDVRTRNGRSITSTSSVPELAGLHEAFRGHALILDGELVAGQGRPDDFYRLGPRLSATKPCSVLRWSRREPVTFAAFDVLYLDGVDLRATSYLERRSRLESLALSGARWCTVASYETRALNCSRRAGNSTSKAS